MIIHKGADHDDQLLYLYIQSNYAIIIMQKEKSKNMSEFKYTNAMFKENAPEQDALSETTTLINLMSHASAQKRFGEAAKNVFHMIADNFANQFPGNRARITWFADDDNTDKFSINGIDILVSGDKITDDTYNTIIATLYALACYSGDIYFQLLNDETLTATIYGFFADGTGFGPIPKELIQRHVEENRADDDKYDLTVLEFNLNEEGELA